MGDGTTNVSKQALVMQVGTDTICQVVRLDGFSAVFTLHTRGIRRNIAVHHW